jgi:hypothetical protein
MSKKAQTLTAPTPILVVYGIDDKGQTRAATFFETDFEQARKAAGLMGLHFFESTADQLRPSLKKVGAGQAYASGWGFVPRIRRQHYDALLSVIASIRPNASLEASNSVFPTSWEDIGKESLVLAQADSAEFGWWPSIVEKVDGPMLTLRWQNFSKDSQFKRHVTAVALVKPPHGDRVEG